MPWSGQRCQGLHADVLPPSTTAWAATRQASSSSRLPGTWNGCQTWSCARGHGLESALLAAVTVCALRNARRDGLTLPDTVQTTDAVLGAQFGPDRFVTGIVGELDIATGWWRWASCGHPAALLVRGGRVVKELDAVVGVPLGLGMLEGGVELGAERLERGDRLLLYTDGVVEARNARASPWADARDRVHLTWRSGMGNHPGWLPAAEVNAANAEGLSARRSGSSCCFAAQPAWPHGTP